jgi:hypothetical protein
MSPRVPQDIAQSRAARYSFALGDQSPGSQQIYQQIVSGRENLFRNAVAQQQDIQTAQQRNEILSQFISARSKLNEPLTSGDLNFVSGLSSKDFADPNTTLEQLYANRVLNSMSNQPGQDARLNSYAASENASNAIDDVARDTVTIRSDIQKMLERIPSSGISSRGCRKA